MNDYNLEKTEFVTIYRLKKVRYFCCLAQTKLPRGTNDW